MPTTPTRSYRCTYHPKDLNGHPTMADSGVLPFVQIKARDAEDALRKAFHLTGSPIAGVERIEVAA